MNAAVLACVGMMGVVSLTGCANLDNGNAYQTEQGTNDFWVLWDGQLLDADGTEFVFRIHGGGGGSTPFYVVHLTEQEALGIIREQLKAVGLNFNAIPPSYTAGGWRNIGLDLFDEEKNIAVAQICWEESIWARSGFAEEISREFERVSGVTVGVFYNPAADLGCTHTFDGESILLPTPTAEEKEAMIPYLKKYITEQVQAFIAVLQDAGIIERPLEGK